MKITCCEMVLKVNSSVSVIGLDPGIRLLRLFPVFKSPEKLILNHVAGKVNLISWILAHFTLNMVKIGGYSKFYGG
jgi:hypothetical protein